MKVAEERTSRVTMKKIVAFVFVLIFVNLCLKFFNSEKSPDKVLEEFATENNKSLPKMINSEIRFDSINSSGNNIQYNMTFVNIERENVEVQKMQTDLRRNLLNTLKSDPKLKAFRDNGVVISYVYNDKNKSPLCKINFTSGQY